MGTTADKLTYLAETKELIRQAIINKGVNVETSDPFRIYPEKIEEISGGGGGAEWVNFTEDVVTEFTAPVSEWNNSPFLSLMNEITLIEEVPYVFGNI